MSSFALLFNPLARSYVKGTNCVVQDLLLINPCCLGSRYGSQARHTDTVPYFYFNFIENFKIIIKKLYNYELKII